MKNSHKLFAAAQAWWLFWLFIASIGLLEIKTLSIEVLMLGVALAASTIAGYSLLFLRGNSNKLQNIPKKEYLIFSDNVASLKSWRYCLFFTVIVIAIDGYFLTKAIAIFADEGLIGYRLKTFSREGEPSILYGSAQIELLRLIIVSPLTLYITLCSIAMHTNFQRTRYLMPAIIITSIQTINSLGRFQFYILIALFIFSKILSGRKLLTKKAIGLLSVVFVLFVVISGLRDNYEDKNVFVEVAKSAVHDYHIVGLILFDNDFHDKNSFINTNTTYGRAVLGGVDRLLTLIITRFDTSFELGLKDTGATRQESIDVGNNSVEKIYNAHRTVMYLAYADGGVVGVVIYGFVFGIIFAYSGIMLQRKRRISDFMMLLLLAYSSFLSIFTSPLEDISFWACVVLIILTRFNFKIFESKPLKLI